MISSLSFLISVIQAKATRRTARGWTAIASAALPADVA
jgi:hypothetical protein